MNCRRVRAFLVAALLVVGVSITAADGGHPSVSSLQHQLPRFGTVMIAPLLFEELLEMRERNVQQLRVSRTIEPTALESAPIRTASGFVVRYTPRADDRVVVVPAAGQIPAKVCLSPKHLTPDVDALARSPRADTQPHTDTAGGAAMDDFQQRPSVAEVFTAADRAAIAREISEERCLSERIKDGEVNDSVRLGSYEWCPRKYVRWFNQTQVHKGGNMADRATSQVVFGRFDPIRSELQVVGDHLVAVYPRGDPCPDVAHEGESPLYSTAGRASYETVIYLRCGDPTESELIWSVREMSLQCRVVITVYLHSVCDWAQRVYDAQSYVVPCMEIADEVAAEFAQPQKPPL